jgi:hypothetical protein
LRKITLVMLFIVLFFIPLFAEAQSISDYLIFNDIGTFKMDQPHEFFVGEPPTGGPRVDESPGVLKGTGHFPDHTDKSYEVMYIDSAGVKPGTEVEVTHHVGGDSDRWLRHEIEAAYRTSKIERLGLLSKGTRLREINGNKIIGMRGSGYTWINNYTVVDISYTDLDGTKPEPLEIVQAYLAKYPSTITTTDDELKSNTYNIKWIKDEIDRRLWLCDKWNGQFVAGVTTQKDLIYYLVSNMEVFLNYREAYFGMKAMDDMSALHQLQKNKDIISINKKLTEYKTWWSANKGKSIHL